MKPYVFAILLSAVAMSFVPNAAPFPAQHKPKMAAVRLPKRKT